MRTFVILMTACALVFGYALALHAEEKAAAPASASEEMAAKKKQAAEIMTKMRAIEKEAASQDEECKKITAQMMELEKQKRARLNTLLENNQDYQALKKQLMELMPQPQKVESKEAPKK
ncbi:MAG: hypothetical protein NC831_07910 [Candidatus Omnitrophica bacterium]|nr:hypothetical protein [Candidatus Omnitrophota bacterium]MCM8827674.1 hypothetical protein [Candidatus Omnitrophota bacterium]